MKKLSTLILGLMLLLGITTCKASDTGMQITLKPGLNTFSTPAIVNSIQFSNGGDNITFATMENGKWKSFAVNGDTIEKLLPLEGFIIRNDNSNDVTMTIKYETDNSNSLVLSKELDAGWNFLGVTKTNNPFNDIANTTATMILDLTKGGSTNLIQLGKTFIDATNFMISKAYAVFVNDSNGIYGGVNNYGDNTCHGMDEANVQYIYNNGEITINWDAVDGNVVEIGLFNPEFEGYTFLRSGNMEEGTFTYQPQQQGDQYLLIRNECSDLYLKASTNTPNSYPVELEEAYTRAYENGIITESSIDDANLYSPLNNKELAEIMNKFVEEILGDQPNSSKPCEFDDISGLTSSEQETIIKSCQLGLMPAEIDSGSFNPNENSNRITFGTALSRAFRNGIYSGGNPYYINHLNALKDAGIMQQINNPENHNEIKGYVLMMLKIGTDYNCDINGDGEINKNDLTTVNSMIIDDAMGNAPCDKKICDLNRDKIISVSDRNIKKCVGRNNIDRCDINEDGVINSNDQSIIAEHVANGGTICTIEKCDLNGDHDITSADIMYQGCNRMGK